MRIPYGFTLTSSGTLEINRSEANVVRMIFDFYMAGASLGKVVDMLHAKQISSPTGKAKWTRAAVDHLLSKSHCKKEFTIFVDQKSRVVDNINLLFIRRSSSG